MSKKHSFCLCYVPFSQGKGRNPQLCGREKGEGESGVFRTGMENPGSSTRCERQLLYVLTTHWVQNSWTATLLYNFLKLTLHFHKCPRRCSQPHLTNSIKAPLYFLLQRPVSFFVTSYLFQVLYLPATYHTLEEELLSNHMCFERFNCQTHLHTTSKNNAI